MNFNIVCDESGMCERRLVIGAVTIPRANHDPLVAELNALKGNLKLRPEGEIKWGKVSTAYASRYLELAAWFFSHLKANALTFRAHVIDTTTPHYRRYGNNDLEHSFYKAYFHVLYQSIVPLALSEEGSNVLVLMDDKKNRYRFHLDVMRRGLNIRLAGRCGLKQVVSKVEPRQSSGPTAEPFIQIVDLLIGAVGYVRNGHILEAQCCGAKKKMVSNLENMAGVHFKFDTAVRAPFNIFSFDAKIAMQAKRLHQEKRKAALAPSFR